MYASFWKFLLILIIYIIEADPILIAGEHLRINSNLHKKKNAVTNYKKKSNSFRWQ